MGITIVILIAVVFALINSPIQTNTTGSLENSQQTTSTQETEKTATLTNKTQPATLSYSDAIKIYGDKRMQFGLSNGYCSVTPNNATFKSGTKFMLDNRINKQLTISLDGKPHVIKAYGFEIITLGTTLPLPHTIKVDCGTERNNASILIQQ